MCLECVMVVGLLVLGVRFLVYSLLLLVVFRKGLLLLVLWLLSFLC